MPAKFQVWTQNSSGVDDVAESQGCFGRVVVAADFDGDGFDDLAIGVPNEKPDGHAVSGGVNMLRGGLLGLSADHDQFLSEYDVRGGGADGTDFGQTLAFGRFDDRGPALVIGAPKAARYTSSSGSFVFSAAASTW